MFISTSFFLNRQILILVSGKLQSVIYLHVTMETNIVYTLYSVVDKVTYCAFYD